MEYATLVESDRRIKGAAIYQCHEGYKHVQGNLTMVCSSVGMWGGEEPVCEGVWRNMGNMCVRVCGGIWGTCV